MNRMMKFGSWLILIIALGLIASASQIELKTSGGASFPGSVNSSSYMKAANFSCTDCLGKTQIEDVYVPYSGTSSNLNQGAYDYVSTGWVNCSNSKVTGSVTAANFSCTDCLGKTQIEDVYVPYSGTSSNLNMGTNDIYGTGQFNGSKMKLTGVATAANFSCTDCLGLTQIEDVYVRKTGDTMSGDIDMNNNGITEIDQANFSARSDNDPAINIKGGQSLIMLQANSSTDRPSIRWKDVNGKDIVDMQAHNMSGAIEHRHFKIYTNNDTVANEIQGRFAISYGTSQAVMDILYSNLNLNYNPIYGVQNLSINPNAATDKALKVNLGTLSTEYGIWAYSNIGATANQPLLYFDVDNTAFDQRVMFINNDGTKNSIYIDSEAAAQDVVVIDKVATGSGAGLTITDNSANSYVSLIKGKTSSIGESVFYRNYNAGNTSGAVVMIVDEHAGGDQATLFIKQKGTGNGIQIDTDGANAINVIDGSILVADGNVTISDQAGVGNMYACFDSAGKLYRSVTACVI
jgi:hypothetical protein